MQLVTILENTVYFLALINPVSKVLFMAAQKPAYNSRRLKTISLRASGISFIILAILACLGDFLLARVLHIEIYSLSVAGGIILFSIGINAVKKESFIDPQAQTDMPAEDPTIVPLATPLIAGPGTMTAAITFASMHGVPTTLICILLALVINLGLMLLSHSISKTLERLNVIGPTIRITGLIVTAVATQMILSGLGTWLKRLI